MSVVFYKPGKTHKIKGIPCTLQTCIPETVDFKAMKKAGWFKSIVEFKEFYKSKKETKNRVI